MASTSALPARCGWAKSTIAPGQSEKPSASASRARPAGYFVSTNEAIPSSAARSAFCCPSRPAASHPSLQNSLSLKRRSRLISEFPRPSFPGVLSLLMSCSLCSHASPRFRFAARDISGAPCPIPAARSVLRNIHPFQRLDISLDRALDRHLFYNQ